MDSNIGHAACRWSDNPNSDYKPVNVDGWYVVDNMDDPDAGNRHPAGYVLTLDIGTTKKGYKKYAQVVLSEQNIRDILDSIEGRR